MATAFLLYGVGGQIVCTLIGFLYPAYESFKAIESNSALTAFWLRYWIVFAFISTFEHMLYYILVWIPFYYPIKLGLLYWLFATRTQGANYAYRWMVSPILRRNQRTIDQCLGETKTGLARAIRGTVGVSVNVTMAVGGDSVKNIRRRAIEIAPVAARKVGGAATKLMLDVGSMRVGEMVN